MSRRSPRCSHSPDFVLAADCKGCLAIPTPGSALELCITGFSGVRIHDATDQGIVYVNGLTDLSEAVACLVVSFPACSINGHLPVEGYLPDDEYAKPLLLIAQKNPRALVDVA